MPKPNVLWIMTDQFNANCMSFLGSQAQTPNLDRIAAQGVTFERAYCNNPICAPSRVSFITGQYLHTHGLQGNNVVMYPHRNSDTVSALFRRSGYRTGLLGKAHMPRLWNEEGFERLRYTDLCDALPADPTTTHYFQYLDERGLAGWYEEGTARPESPGHNDGSVPADLPYEHSIERYTGNETLCFLQDGLDDARPFFIQMTFQRPHGPIRPARQYFDLYNPDEIELPASAVDYFERRFAGKPAFMVDRLKDGCRYPLADPDPGVLRRVIASYYALITCIDMEIGRVLDWLQEHGQAENTIVVFSADHGDFAGEHGLFHKNLGIYESIHRIPFLLRIPGGPAGTRREQIIESIDLYPTLCELAGLDVPDCVEGSSLLPIVGEDALGKEEALAEWSWGGATARINALRTERYRLVYYARETGGELYDHSTDRGEVHNLWDDPRYTGVQMEMLQRLFDRVNAYRAASEFQDDVAIHHQRRWMPTEMMHKRRLDWDVLKEVYARPVPGRGPWKPMEQ
jgi:choline-sulfatase